jgi:type IV pilus assembly protein PilN
MTPSARRWVGGFNLLPWRRSEVRIRRRRIVLQWLAAALLGCACAAPVAAWRVWQRVQLEGERRALEPSLAQLRAPLAEQRRLAREADERQRQITASAQRAKPLTRLLGLLDELASADVDGVSLHQVAHRAADTELQATLSGEAVTAAWLARLRALPEVATVSIREMKRPAAGGARAHERQRGPLQATAQLTWAVAVADDAPSRPRGAKPALRSGG